VSRPRRIALLLPLVLVAAGCGSHRSSPPTGSTGISALPPTTLTVFRVVHGALRAESVRVPHTTAVAAASLRALGLGATVAVSEGTARVDLPGATPARIAEVVYTLTQYRSIRRVDIGGRGPLTRRDVAAFVPPILIESPADGAAVPARFHARGVASVFEATFVLEIVVAGKVEERRTVTASAGAPELGTFDAVLQARRSGPAQLVAFAPSAENGTPQHRVAVRLTVAP